MSIRKPVGWLVFAALMAVLLLQVPRLAGEACFLVGSKFYAAGNYKAAASAFSGAVRVYPRFARGYIELGSSYLELKKYEQAEKAFLKAKSLDDDSCASCGLGMTYYQLNRPGDAETEFKRAMSLNPNDVCAYHQSGKMYYELGKYREAIAAFKQALTLYPSYGRYMYLGNAYVYARDYEPGVEAYKKAIQLNSKNVRAHLQLGIAYDYLRRYEDAAAEFKEAIKLDPDDDSAYYYLALDYVALHNKPAALEQYERLRKIDPDTAAELIEKIQFSENRKKGKETLYFVPLSKFSAASLTKLVNFCKEKIGVQAIVTPPVSFTLSTIDKRRQQVIAEQAIELIKLRYPNLAADPNAIVIGLTDEDMYISKEKWEYVFSYRTLGRFAVVSSARMNPVNFGGSANEVVVESRMRKMVMKNIGAIFYQFPLNYDPKSVLFDGIRGVEAIDNMGEDF